VLANTLDPLVFDIDELAEETWNPMAANPGQATYALTARAFAPAGERLRSVAGRLAAVPSALDTARRTLGAMPRVHIETALGQFAGTARLIGDGLEPLLEEAPTLRREIDAVRAVALTAIEEHRRWLAARLDAHATDDSFADPRIGADRFVAKLALSMETQSDAAGVLAAAEADLKRVSAEIAELAARRSNGMSGADAVRQALNALATDAPDSAIILGVATDALASQRAFVDVLALVTTYDDPVKVIEMPEIDRGVAVAYCNPPVPLETAPIPTFVAVSPTPADWPAERVVSFFREYNRHMVHDLMVHEAMPGHVLQLQHANRFHDSSPIRAAFYSESFVEGWAVYAEELMADTGYSGNGDPDALRLQQLKMQLRMIINAILDARVHCEAMPEEVAMALMTRRGFQEEGEAAGKWRRALLTSAQFSTYFVGYAEVRDLVAEERRRHSALGLRAVHDRVLAHGSPSVRHLRTLLA
jgi:uncharacterized protein (DUF885 family)